MNYYCISDIHGHMKPFEKLLSKISDYSKLILIGDYIDRGPDSKQVVETIIHLHKQGAKVIMGNHDNMFVQWLDNDWDTLHWIQHGGYETLKSYGINLDDSGMNENKLNENRKKIKDTYYSHYLFLKELPLYYYDDKYIFVHAGIDPNHIDWKKTSDKDFLTIRNRFFKSRYPLDFPQTVIFGHTATRNITGEDYNGIWFGNQMIGIDGFAANGYGGQLNCLVIEDNNFRELSIKI